jgi:hypothetical protein
MNPIITLIVPQMRSNEFYSSTVNYNNRYKCLAFTVDLIQVLKMWSRGYPVLLECGKKFFWTRNRILSPCLQRWLMGSVRQHLCCVEEGPSVRWVSVLKCSAHPQRRKLTSVTTIRLNVATRLSSVVIFQRNVCASPNPSFPLHP